MANQEIQVVDKKELSPESAEITRNGVYFTPAVDIFENSNELTVVVDMPGINSEDVEVDLRENILTIIGDTKAEEFDGQELLTEYRTGGYYQNVQGKQLDRSRKNSRFYERWCAYPKAAEVGESYPEKDTCGL